MTKTKEYEVGKNKPKCDRAVDKPQLEKTCKVNQRAVWSVSFSSDGQRLATAGGDGTVRLWDLQGQQLAAWQADLGALRNVIFSQNRQLLITAGDGGTVRLWDLQGQQLAAWQAQSKSQYLWSVSFNPNSQQRLATAGNSGIVCLWNLQGQLLASLDKRVTSFVRSISFSPDGQRLATAGDSGIVCLWNLQDKPQLEKTYKVNQRAVWSVSFSSDGKLLAITDSDGNVKLWQIESFDELMQRGCHWIEDYLTNNPNVSESDRNLILDKNF